MTATLEQPHTLTHPLNATLQKLQAGFDWVKLYTKPEGENWYSYQDIIRQESGVFAMLLETYTQHASHLNQRQITQNLFNALSWWCAAACYAPVLIDERSPLVASGLHFHLHQEGYIDTVALEFAEFLCLPQDEAATHPKASVVKSREELVGQALNYLESMIQPLINVIKGHAAVQDKGLWLYVADDIVGLVLHVKQALKQQDTCEAEVEKVLGQLPQRGQTGVLEVTCGTERKFYTQRSTCCFYYLDPKSDNKKCATCPRLPVEERLERLQGYMAERVKERESAAGA